ncbi:helix-turn-helix domain-containing protein [Streptomyces cucumeris]|uniref:helix-turn-helix domain-containing protein n=1 Tax=Streptomyces cucumeris TaxID=2962890 RepID=UPI003D7605B9
MKGTARQRTAMGGIAGFMLRMIRESVPQPRNTQAGLAEALGVDLATVQGWESGRRPLANMKAGAFLDLRRRLLAFGGEPAVLGLLDAAMDADRVIASTLDPDGLHRHPLADWVHTRDTAHMIAWAVNGTTPTSLAHRPTTARRGPVPPAPLLSQQDRGNFFSRLRHLAEAAAYAGEHGLLLHRQALYLSSYDRSREATSWTAHALHARRDLLAAHGWSPHWAAARSTASALVRLGDPQPLVDFIEKAMADDDAAEVANLNYWAYWLGAIRESQANDGFMRNSSTDWEPIRLMRGLVIGLDQAPGFVDLYAHSVWALLTVQPWLPLAAPQLADRLAQRTQRLLDGDQISTRSRRELGVVHYVLRENRS